MITNKQRFNDKYNFPKDAPHSKAEISRVTGIPLRVLSQVYDRGVGARKTNPSSVRSASSGKKVGGKSLSGKIKI